MELEIEFKNVLTKQQYEYLLQHYRVSEQQIITQANHYFETADFALKNARAALRIRETSTYIECTLKEKSTESRSFETNVSITHNEKEQILNEGFAQVDAIANRLQNLNIPLDELQLFGTLTTDRVELPYLGGLLVFDHSFYLHQDDYEVEYETSNEIEGLSIFENFLKEHAIEHCVAPKKIARFMDALAKKGM